MDSALTVKNYYANDAAKIEQVELSDGTKILDAADLRMPCYRMREAEMTRCYLTAVKRRMY